MAPVSAVTPSNELTAEAQAASDRRAAVVERLTEEFDLLCLGRPSAWRIEQALLHDEVRP